MHSFGALHGAQGETRTLSASDYGSEQGYPGFAASTYTGAPEI